MDLLDWTASLGGLITAVVSLFLLAQGQRDRRQLREEHKRATAEKVIFSYTPGERSAAIDADFWPGRVLTIRNYGEQTILNLMITFVSNPSGSTVVTRSEPKQLQTSPTIRPNEGEVLPPHGSLEVKVRQQYSVEPGVGGDFAIVEFTDPSGRRWRRRTDTYELERIPPISDKVPIRHMLLEGIERRTARLGHPIVRLMQAWARFSFRRNTKRIPVAVRIVVWARGHWPLGTTGDAWLLPTGESQATLYEYGDNK